MAHGSKYHESILFFSVTITSKKFHFLLPKEIDGWPFIYFNQSFSFLRKNMSSIDSELQLKIYHERQKRQLCLLHALNNLFQCDEFRQEDLDQICERLDDRKWFNPHRSWIGLGNYDANILLCALQSRGLIGRWFDKRLNASRINFDAVFGCIFNVPSIGVIPFFKGRHWFAVKRIGGAFYNLDSKMPGPTRIDDLVVYSNELLAEGNEILLVVTPENEEKCLVPNNETNAP